MLDITMSSEAKKIDAFMMDTLEIPGLVLMEQAAAAVSKKIMEVLPQGSLVLCVAGSGNNGGDALAVGRILLTQGYDVYIGALSPALPADAAQNLRFFTHTDRLTFLTEDSLPSFFSKDAAAIVDGLFGTGLHRAAQGLPGKIIERINAHKATVFSIDIPSGISADTGAGEKAVWADYTVTFGYAKPGHLLFPGRAHTGILTVAPIGVDAGRPPLPTKWVNKYRLPLREADSYKGTYGRLAVLAGSKGMAGAAILALKAALAGGAGLTTLLGCRYVCDIAQKTVAPAIARCISKEPDYIAADTPRDVPLEAYTAVAAGPGIGRAAATGAIIRDLAGLNIPKVIDADALTLLSERLPAFGRNTVLTPHIGEFARLSSLAMGKIAADPIACATAFAEEHKIVVLLKGATSIITNGTSTYIVTAGTPGMAKGGSGDVLTGVIGAFLAQGLPPAEAAYGAAYLCGKAGEYAAACLSEYACTPEDTITSLGKAILQEYM